MCPVWSDLHACIVVPWQYWRIGRDRACWGHRIWCKSRLVHLHLHAFDPVMEDQRNWAISGFSITTRVEGIREMHPFLWQWGKCCHVLFGYTRMVSEHTCWFPSRLNCHSVCYSIEPLEMRWTKSLNSRMYASQCSSLSPLLMYKQWLCVCQPWWQALTYFQSWRWCRRILVSELGKGSELHTSNKQQLYTPNKVATVMESRFYRRRWWLRSSIQSHQWPARQRDSSWR